ncbi:MAG: Flp family type IVb pilin [Roseobacter sp.]
MVKYFERFWESEDGAVTVDWVVLTAAVVGLGAIAVVTLQAETNTVGDRTTSYMERQDVTRNPDIQDF